MGAVEQNLQYWINRATTAETKLGQIQRFCDHAVALKVDDVVYNIRAVDVADIYRILEATP